MAKKVKHSKNFERYKKWYNNGHGSITIEQLEHLVEAGLLTEAEMQEIIGQDGTPNE